MGSGKVLLGALAGVAVGATLGILFAPDKGTVTSKQISDKGDEYSEGLEEKFSGFIDGITRRFVAVREEAIRISRDSHLKIEHDGEGIKREAN
jgi:gas vesicle protein